MATTTKKLLSSKPKARESTRPSAKAQGKSSTRTAHEAALEAKTLLENLQLVDDLMSRRTLTGGKVALVNFQRSILHRLAVLHGHDAALLRTKTLSGASWVKKFPDSKSTSDLEATFSSNVDDFIDSMETAGANVSIGTTLRPKERAHLMHYSYLVAEGQIQPAAVPDLAGVDIEWDHGDAAASVKAAQDMVDGYAIVAAPALNSRHTEGKAIDMTISWSGALNLKDKSGSDTKITTTPRTGENADLVKVGKTFGVIKATFAGDPPHWSTDGH